MTTPTNKESADLFRNFQQDADACEGCEYQRIIRDHYNTGDSPDDVECACLVANDCPKTIKIYNRIDELKQDPDMLQEALIESDSLIELNNAINADDEHRAKLIINEIRHAHYMQIANDE